MFLLDTNTISLWIKGSNAAVQRHFDRTNLSGLFVSSIVEADLRYGIAKNGLEKSRVGLLVETFLTHVTILPWITPTAKSFAKLRTQSESKGITVATVDLMIASHAHEHHLRLVTQDKALFRLTPWIGVTDWTK